MAITAEINGDEIRVKDTAAGDEVVLTLRASVTITEFVGQRLDVVNNTTDSSLAFGGVTAGKVFALKPDGAVSIKLNGGTTSLPITTGFLIVDTAGGITAATISNASGATRSVRYFVGG